MVPACAAQLLRCCCLAGKGGFITITKSVPVVSIVATGSGKGVQVTKSVQAAPAEKKVEVTKVCVMPLCLGTVWDTTACSGILTAVIANL